MLSDREELLLWGTLLLFVIYLLIKYRRRRQATGKRLRSESIPVTRINVIRYSIGSRLLWFAVLLVCMTAVMVFAWHTGSMSGTALIVSVIVILILLILFNLPMFMTLTSIRPALAADRFNDELCGQSFRIDGGKLTCVTKNWYVVLCDTASFVLHAPDIDFEKTVIQSDRSLQINGKFTMRYQNSGTRVFLKNGKTVFVPGTMTPRIKQWFHSHKQSA